MIAMCLVKDPSKRPSAQKLLKHTFFKQARSSDYIARKILEGLPTLGDRLKALKVGRLLYGLSSSSNLWILFSHSQVGLNFTTAQGSRHACSKENARWGEGGDIPGLVFFFFFCFLFFILFES